MAPKVAHLQALFSLPMFYTFLLKTQKKVSLSWDGEEEEERHSPLSFKGRSVLEASSFLLFLSQVSLGAEQRREERAQQKFSPLFRLSPHTHTKKT